LKTLTFVWTYALLCAALWFYLDATAPPKTAPLVIAPFCTDPYAEFNKRAWDYCDNVDRYYEI
jgi:ABC-type transporter lipoprotein component MlaA